MKLNRNHYIILLGIVVIIAWLTYSGFKTSNIETNNSDAKLIKSTDLKELVLEEKKKVTEFQLKRISELEKDKSQLKKLVVLWDSIGRQLPAAYYMWQLAESEPTEANWLMTGSKYYNVAMMSNDSNLYLVAGNQSKLAFEKVLELNPNNLDAKNALAACLVDIDHDIMKGVGILKQVISVDSNNVQALFTLGMLSVQSGQFEKAEQRFERLIEIQPFNAEFYYYLGEVYAKQGNKDKAIQTYEKCKTLLTDKAAQKDIESLINKLKTI